MDNIKCKNHNMLGNLLFSLLILVFLFPTFLFAQSGWGPDRRLTYFHGYSYDPKAVCSGDTIHLVWWEGYVDTMIHEEVFYKRSTDAGLSWDDDVRLSVEDEQNSTSPIIGCAGSQVYVFWGEHDVGAVFRKSTDGGTTWGPIDSTLQGASYQDVEIFDDSIFLAGGRQPGDIIFRKSTDGGNTWLPLKVVGYGAYVRQAVSPPVIGFIYQVDLGAYEIMFKRSMDNGITWPDSVIISEDNIKSGQWPRICCDDNCGFHVVWFDYEYSPYPWTGDIFYRASRDSGNTWDDIDSLTVMHRAVASNILAESTNLHLVWEDDRHDFGNNYEIYYRMSTDLGQTWRSEVRLTDTLNWSRMPSLACSGSYLHLFWFDLRDDTTNRWGEIYYKRKDLVVPISEENKTILTSKSKVDIYPNPFSSTLNIKMRFSGENSEIKIFDILGKEVKAYGMKDKAEGIRVDTRSLPSGVYFVEVKAGDATVVRKVMKIR